MTIHCLQHVSFETPVTILEWAALQNHTVTYTCFFGNNFSFPQPASIDCLLIMGGCMNVDEEDRYPWLKQEKDFIRQCIQEGKKLLGICLGAQLIASVLGAGVYRNHEKEIGFFPVQFSSAAKKHPCFAHFSDSYRVFHWHGDTFDLPVNARLIASSQACTNQAFMIGDNIIGLQFHPEMNTHAIEQMLLHDGQELTENGPFIQSKEEISIHYSILDQNKQDLFILLDNFLR